MNFKMDEAIGGVPPNETENVKPEENTVGCSHYKRKSKFVTPCCNKIYTCRFCHDEVETHSVNRKEITELICTICETRQKVQTNCEKCGIRFGKYTCLECNLFDDEYKNQYHCVGCGFCRIGGNKSFFHCEKCNMCLPMTIKDKHKCLENISRSNCPVCLEDIHTARVSCHIPNCGHLLHRPCFEQLLQSGLYTCPICQTSLMNMSQLWQYLDHEIERTPMPLSYRNKYVDILCKDCHKKSSIVFHVVGLKCTACGSYNTCKADPDEYVQDFVRLNIENHGNGSQPEDDMVLAVNPLDLQQLQNDFRNRIIAIVSRLHSNQPPPDENLFDLDYEGDDGDDDDDDDDDDDGDDELSDNDNAEEVQRGLDQRGLADDEILGFSDME